MEKCEAFSSIMEKYRLKDPCLPSKSWDSIAFESINSASQRISTTTDGEIHAEQISESALVELALSSLQGVDSALTDMWSLSATFDATPADLCIHRVPSLWYRSSSTKVLGKLLSSIAHYGTICSDLHKFVDYFVRPNLDFHENTTKCKGDVRGSYFIGRKNKKPLSNSVHGRRPSYLETNPPSAIGSCPPYSMINHAFATAVDTVLQGYICSLNTLHTSVALRRSSSATGFVIDSTLSQHGITLLEVYMHTEELRTHVESLGTICMLSSAQRKSSQTLEKHEVGRKLVSDFDEFPRGADLLTYLYQQLQDADPVREMLFKFLFYHSCEPYFRLIRSWIYQASIVDPYKEFLVGYSDDLTFDSAPDGHPSLPICKVNEGASVPCFLKDVQGLILRAGQQLQVLIKMLDFFGCQFIGICYEEEVHVNLESANLEVILPFWNCSSHDLFYPTLSLSKHGIEDLIGKRKAMYSLMEEYLHNFFLLLKTRPRKINHETLLSGGEPVQLDLPGLITSVCECSASPDAAGGTTTLVSDMEENLISLSASELLSCELNSSTDVSETSESCLSDDYEEKYLDVRPVQHVSFIDCLNKIVVKKSSQVESLKSLDEATSSLLIGNSLENHHGDTKPSASFVEDEAYSKTLAAGRFLKNPFISNVAGGNHVDCNQFEISLESLDIHPHRFSHGYNILSTNPMFARFDWLGMMPMKGRRQIGRVPYFDFSSVQDPCNVKGADDSSRTSLPECPWFSVEEHASCGTKKTQETRDFLSCNMPEGKSSFAVSIHCQSVPYPSILPSGSLLDHSRKEVSLRNFSGGAQWESMLKGSGKGCKNSTSYRGDKFVDSSETPLHVIIDCCIVQEISLQHKLVSGFSVRLLEEGFDLQDNFLALRRYHFMEAADWADTFLGSLPLHMSYNDKARSISVIQGLLDSALQSSSCERDKYRERLFIYDKQQSHESLSTHLSGIHVYDFISLGYMVDWPVSIILTPEALKIYGSIFGFLIKIKLALFSLLDVWFSFKNLKQIQKCRTDGSETDCLNNLFKLRQQLNHFLTALQLYVQSQLLHNAWCRFCHNLKHKVKDLFDLESVHMAYLLQALEICFQSAEMQAAKNTIDNILECALSFRSCFVGYDFQIGHGSSSDVLSQINFSQVLAVKATFERNLKELHSCYSKSARNSELGICLFWEYLNSNGYFSNMDTLRPCLLLKLHLRETLKSCIHVTQNVQEMVN